MHLDAFQIHFVNVNWSLRPKAGVADWWHWVDFQVIKHRTEEKYNKPAISFQTQTSNNENMNPLSDFPVLS